jgi:hypothetical protein
VAVQKDIISPIYKELFTVKFLHAGYGAARKSLLAEDMHVEPDAATKEIFANHNLGYRFFNDTLICFIRTELLSPPSPSPKVPFIKFTSPIVIRFLINVSSGFLSKTNVVVTGSQQVYQFNNQVNAGTGGFICMHIAGVDNDDLKSAAVVKPDNPCFGVIDISSTGAVNSTYEIFTGGPIQELKSPAYSIQLISKI